MSDLIMFDFNTQSVRLVMINNEPWWLAKDICNVLEIIDVSNACKKLDGDEKLTRTLCVSGQNREVLLINEPGLYTLVLTSRKPQAKEFKRWLTHEVIPSIRKTGSYSVKPQLPCHEEAVIKADAVRHITDTLDDNPRLAQFLIDHTISDLMGSQQAKLTGVELKGVVEIANDLGFEPNPSNRSKLGKYVKYYCGDLAQKEKRLVNGTMRRVYCYPDNEKVREVVTTFFS